MKTKLLAALNRSYTHELALIKELTDTERNAIGMPERWSVKDLIAHIAAWQQRVALILDAAARGETPPRFDDEAGLNAQTFAKNQQRPWVDVLADAERAVADLRAQVERLSEAELTDPQHFAWREGRPLWQPIAANGYGHPQAHLAQFYLERADLPRATHIQEALVETRLSLDDSPHTRANALYNLACFYATTGQSASALSKLREALSLDPDLIEWSKQDGDLIALRMLDEYKALATSA